MNIKRIIIVVVFIVLLCAIVTSLCIHFAPVSYDAGACGGGFDTWIFEKYKNELLQKYITEHNAELDLIDIKIMEESRKVTYEGRYISIQFNIKEKDEQHSLYFVGKRVWVETYKWDLCQVLCDGETKELSNYIKAKHNRNQLMITIWILPLLIGALIRLFIKWKKGLIIIISVLLILIVASVITKYIDTANVTTGHEPECCIKIVSQDGSKVTYLGLGYKVVRYVGVFPDEPYEDNIGVKMGSLFMKYEKPTNVILDVRAFGTGNIFKVSEKADVDFIANLLKNSKYINEPCKGIADYAITYDNYTYDILIDCSEIKRGNKQAKITDKDMKELERILVKAADKRRIFVYEESVEELSKPYLSLDEENKKFQFFWSMFSSYIAQGTYEVKDNEIICKTDDRNNVYTFEILEDGYKFIADKSSPIPKYKYSSDANEALSPVVDGAIFD